MFEALTLVGFASRQGRVVIRVWISRARLDKSVRPSHMRGSECDWMTSLSSGDVSSTEGLTMELSRCHRFLDDN